MLFSVNIQLLQLKPLTLDQYLSLILKLEIMKLKMKVTLSSLIEYLTPLRLHLLENNKEETKKMPKEVKEK
jgi:hypothetical protein